jgi:hypothetical protein
MKIAYNTDFGGFGHKVEGLLREIACARTGIECFEEISRTDKNLIELLESGEYDNGSIVVAEIPDGRHVHIVSHDGRETVLYSNSEIKEGK